MAIKKNENWAIQSLGQTYCIVCTYSVVLSTKGDEKLFVTIEKNHTTKDIWP